VSSAFPRPIDQRPEEWGRALVAAVKRLQAKTAFIETGCTMTSYIGTIPGTYTSGDPTVVLATGTVLGPLQHLKSYTPVAGDIVLVVPVGQTYIVAGTFA